MALISSILDSSKKYNFYEKCRAFISQFSKMDKQALNSLELEKLKEIGVVSHILTFCDLKSLINLSATSRSNRLNVLLASLQLLQGQVLQFAIQILKSPQLAPRLPMIGPQLQDPLAILPKTLAEASQEKKIDKSNLITLFNTYGELCENLFMDRICHLNEQSLKNLLAIVPFCCKRLRAAIQLELRFFSEVVNIQPPLDPPILNNKYLEFVREHCNLYNPDRALTIAGHIQFAVSEHHQSYLLICQTLFKLGRLDQGLELMNLLTDPIYYANAAEYLLYAFVRLDRLEDFLAQEQTSRARLALGQPNHIFKLASLYSAKELKRYNQALKIAEKITDPIFRKDLYLLLLSFLSLDTITETAVKASCFEVIIKFLDENSHLFSMIHLCKELIGKKLFDCALQLIDKYSQRKATQNHGNFEEEKSNFTSQIFECLIRPPFVITELIVEFKSKLQLSKESSAKLDDYIYQLFVKLERENNREFGQQAISILASRKLRLQANLIIMCLDILRYS